MYALIIVTCSLSGAGCNPHLIASGMSLTECQVASIPSAARFIGEHPDLRLQRFTCTPNPRQHMQEREI